MSSWGLQTAARTIFQEANLEPPDGQRAVAHAIVNRLKSGLWGHSLAAVCLSRNQFSAWGPVTVKAPKVAAAMTTNFRASCELADEDPALIRYAGLIQAALDGEPDPTNGATHYHAASMTPPPVWTVGAVFCGRHGNQLFYRGVK